MADASATREFDAVIFGATGVTGAQVAAMFNKLGICQKWAIAGRNKGKLEPLQAQHKATGIIIADTSDQASLVRMASSARLVLNATGPYRFFGEPVVKACIEGGADYIDLCGEPAFMEQMLLQYGEKAQAAGVVVCHACAFDSVPADLGILRCAQLFKEAGGECGHVELTHTMEAPFGYTGHDTTFKAAVHGIGAAAELQTLRKGLDQKYGVVPKGSMVVGKLPMRGRCSKDVAGRYMVPFIGSDASVVRMSRRIWAQILKQPDAELQKMMPQFGIYMGVPNTSTMCKLIMGGALLMCFSCCQCGRDMMVKRPACFTCGAFSETGPTPEQMKNNTWIGDFVAQGKIGDSKKTLVVQGRLDDPAYIGTSLLFATVAETIIADRGSLSAPGGVFTPAALFGGSSLMDRLGKRGFEFKVVKSDF